MQKTLIGWWVGVHTPARGITSSWNPIPKQISSKRFDVDKTCGAHNMVWGRSRSGGFEKRFEGLRYPKKVQSVSSLNRASLKLFLEGLICGRCILGYIRLGAGGGFFDP